MPASPVIVSVPDNQLMGTIVGEGDISLRAVEAAFPDTRVHIRGNRITVDGPDASLVGSLFDDLVVLAAGGTTLDAPTIDRVIQLIKDDATPSEVLGSVVLQTARGRTIRPKTAGQKLYVDAMARSTITFAIGPAGTGKSWLAVAAAVSALQRKEVERIVLTRPAVEAGERLGFLPGDLMAKVDPYLRPLYDALYDFSDTDGVERLLENHTVEVAPLAFMRGRTLNNSFIILDEAQNTTPAQMKMFLTRIGFGSRAVVTGDVTQTDVIGGLSGLAGLETVLSGIDGITFVALSQRDVVRHRIVQQIVDAYERAEG